MAKSCYVSIAAVEMATGNFPNISPFKGEIA